MTRIILFIILAFSFSLNAQNEHRFAHPDATWHNCEQSGTHTGNSTEWGPEHYPHYSVQGDTLIKGKMYQTISAGNSFNTYFLRRDSNQRVFAYDSIEDPHIPSGDRLIYDFSLKPGEKLVLNHPKGKGPWVRDYPPMKELIVDSVDTVMLGRPRKRLLLHPYNSSKLVEMIDGIGGIKHLLS